MIQIEKPASVIKEEKLKGATSIVNHFMKVLSCKTVNGLIDMCSTIIEIAKFTQAG